MTDWNKPQGTGLRLTVACVGGEFHLSIGRDTTGVVIMVDVDGVHVVRGMDRVVVDVLVMIAGCRGLEIGSVVLILSGLSKGISSCGEGL